MATDTDSVVSTSTENNGYTVTSVLSKPSDYIIAKTCMLCGGTIPLTKYEEVRLDNGGDISPGICNDCKEAFGYFKDKYFKRKGSKHGKFSRD